MTQEESEKKVQEIRKRLEKDEHGLYIYDENYYKARASIEMHERLQQGLGDRLYRLLIRMTR